MKILHPRFRRLSRTAWISAAALFLAAPLPAGWYRGNTHTHTLNSDGDAAPDAVVRWYREHGYQFVVITDHDFLTDVAPLNALFGAQGKFLVIPGEEVTQMLTDPLHSAAHINAINSRQLVEPIGALRATGGRTAPPGVTPAQTFARNIVEIRTAGGIPQINHPNFKWSLQPEDLFELPDLTLLEIWNAFPGVHNLGGADDSGKKSPSTEELWDRLLSRGQVIWGVASDDSHNYGRFDDPNLPHPGRGWVVVRADELTPAAIASALEHGEFYASNGVTLVDYAAGPAEIAIKIRGDRNVSRFTTRFIGTGGKVLAEVAGMTPAYRPRGDEGYVRAAITDSNGRRAWTQPFFLDQRKTRNFAQK